MRLLCWRGFKGGEVKFGHALLAKICFSVAIEYFFSPRILAKDEPDHRGSLDVGGVDEGGGVHAIYSATLMPRRAISSISTCRAGGASVAMLAIDSSSSSLRPA